ncbi:MAG: TonB-dependent receptor, partial [Candidatus Solibacter usitatus]|nr:TonB-dependent receptor [Candidatus Solibacter usitatus]
VASFAIQVVSVTHLEGLDRAMEEIPAPVQAASFRDIASSGALDLSDFLNRRLSGVHLNEVQGNPFQADLNYRGYTASPLPGTPQGISIYLDGMRLNQPFGDIVSWDLIPRIAISEAVLIPGSNPLFGLNTLGGALSLRTKDGRGQPIAAVQLSGGAFGRKMAELEYGGSKTGGLAEGVHWYLASSFFFEDGWRDSSPSNVRQLFSKLGRQRARSTISLSLAHANNALIGNALQEVRLLARDYASVYTTPDITANRSPFAILNTRHSIANSVSVSVNAYFRYIRARTHNGDINERSLDQAVYQPGAAERAALTAAGYRGFPATGATAANTPFPFWRCIGNVLLRDEPGEKCNGLINRAVTHQRNYGLSGHASWFRGRNQLTAGAAFDGNGTSFSQSTELGYLNPDRSITGTGAIADGVSAGTVDGVPFDTRAVLAGRVHTGSIYATDMLTAGNSWNFTFSGRYNRAVIRNRDGIRPIAGPGSLSGNYVFGRLNPAAGVTFRAVSGVNVYAGYAEGNRAPTSIELGCADANTPCRLPNAMAGDPPLRQVLTRTLEAGIRGSAEGRLRWRAGWFHASNRDDILFVASAQTGFGYFKNFGRTLRQGAEFDLQAHMGRISVGSSYTFLNATFQSPEEVRGTGNSGNEAARKGLPGQESTIAISPGNRIPLIPRHLMKAYADWRPASKLQLDLSVVGTSSSYARGNENNQHKPDAFFYLGEGSSPGYAIVNCGGRFDLSRRVQLFTQVNNLFDRRYQTAAQIGPAGFTETGAFVARPFPAAANGAYPIQQSGFLAPGAPRGVWGGVRFRF